ncbi:MAG: tryptophan--tRNA ligase [Actinomycetes bacterium]|nr:tryptophan--tRNA ligase [Actinomycetes bacterium]
MKDRVLTGYRPTGKLHLGHWFGNLQNMLALQESYDAFYFVADWHALTSEWADPSHIAQFTTEMVLDWLAAGLDPARCTIYRQSDIPEIAEMALYFNMVTPMSWLERTPSYKEQQQQIGDKDLSNVGFFLYPSLMATDIVIMRSRYVPVGEDQAPHLELTREIVRRFNNTYGEYLPEPQALIEKSGARVPGLDGRKMSKSYGNGIFINDDPDVIRKKVMTCLTDPARKLKTDAGDPDICPLHQIHKLIADANSIADWERCCRAAECGCVAHKKALADDLVAYLEPFQARRRELDANPDYAAEVLAAGAAKARPVATETVAQLRQMIGL